MVRDKDGVVYNVEKYCFSVPRNMGLDLDSTPSLV